MEGTGVSQGQRRLIARAIYKNSEYILFDEGKNALDATNEWEIMNTLHEFYKGKTVVIATHRLGTIRNADQIVIMKSDRIVETGMHHQLLKMKLIKMNNKETSEEQYSSYNKIELKSTEVQELMGRVPSSINRMGQGIILLTLVQFCSIGLFLDYTKYTIVSSEIK